PLHREATVVFPLIFSMSRDCQDRDFDNILAALGERELTEWERERLWELLAADPERIAVYADHCFADADFGLLGEADLSEAGIVRPPRNVVTLSGNRLGLEEKEGSSSRRRRAYFAAVAAFVAV